MNPSIRISQLVIAASLLTSGAVAIAKPPAEWQALVSQSKVTLVDAMTRAAQTGNGTVIDIELSKAKSKSTANAPAATPRYEADVINAQGERVEIWVDAASGEAAQHKSEGKAKAKDVKRMGEAKTGLDKAVQTALNETPGTAVGAELDSHWGKTSYQVEVLQANGTVKKVKIDAADGSVIRTKTAN